MWKEPDSQIKCGGEKDVGESLCGRTKEKERRNRI
jgi:hypothetical protein